MRTRPSARFSAWAAVLALYVLGVARAGADDVVMPMQMTGAQEQGLAAEPPARLSQPALTSQPAPGDLPLADRPAYSPPGHAMGVNAGCAGECCPVVCCPQWTVTAGAILLDRTPPHGGAMVSNAGTGETLLDAGNFDFRFAGGMRLGLVRHLGCHDVEFIYFGIDGWNVVRSVRQRPELALSIPPLSSTETFTSAQAGYGSKLYNAELNWKRNLGERFHILAGFRWAELDDRLALDAAGPLLSGALQLDTQTDLYGFQLGADGTLWRLDQRLSLEGFLKAGIYGSHVRTSAETAGTLGVFATRTNLYRASFLGEVGLVGKCRLTDALAVHFGYQCLWLDGVATAADAFNGTDYFRSTPFYHGALVGAELIW